ncbi:MAG TPA: WD40 repeat domain-containing protein, partial [Isosphaeraceae bacterium]|nr:WD40 repeat domain-containing protein [Isosphaeraceae bacterium]
MKRMRGLVLSAIVACLWSGTPANAREELWRQDSSSAFAKGKTERVVVSDSGVIRLGRAVSRVGRLEESHVWDLARSAEGSLYAATGDHGKVYRLEKDGAWKEVLKVDDTQVLSLATRPDSGFFAGTGPGGHVIEWKDEKLSDVQIHQDVQYVWDLVLDRQGTLWAATGPSGQLWKRPEGGEWTRVLDSAQPHLLCLAEAPDGSIYTGSDGEGLIYRVSPEGEVSVVYDAEPSEIHALSVGPDGAVYAASAASESGSRKSTQVPQPGRVPLIQRASFVRKASQDSPPGTVRPKTGAAGENAVFRIDPEGAILEIFRTKALLYALAWSQDRLLVGSGPDGVLFDLRNGGQDWSSEARIDHGQILCLLAGPHDEVWLGAGDPGGVLKLEKGFPESGSYESDVLDTKLVSRFGAMSLEGTWPEGTIVSVQGRSGNVKTPDATWSDWSNPVEAGSSQTPEVPPGRFAQFRLNLSTRDASRSPEVRSVSWVYRTVNQAPGVGKLTIPDLSRGDGSARKTRFDLAWEAEDPNRDTLEYQLSIRKEGWPEWVAIGPESVSE